MRKKKKINKILLYVMICLVGIVMMYPLVWMFFATFKDNSEIFGTLKLLPNSFSFDAYIKGLEGHWKIQLYQVFPEYLCHCDSGNGLHPDFLQYCGLWICKIPFSV